ncbi:DUF6417 family protein [Streptomyces sp. NPDC096311]|uniref:DUF6417 family protein n=1 Tax=Streptomyces sp. NPDC096311 TaxID=3366083 RepID=UPI003809D287
MTISGRRWTRWPDDGLSQGGIRLTLYGHDTLAYGQSRPRAEPSVSNADPDRQLVELIPSQMAALRVFVGLTGRLLVARADGLAEQVRAASCDHGIKRWRLYLTPEQMKSVAYGLWLHRMTGSAAEANRFGREYGVVHSPSGAGGEGSPAGDGLPLAAGATARGAGVSGRG